MRQVRVVLTCDEGFVADTLRDFATAYEDDFGDYHEVEHGSGFLEFIEVPDPEPNLEEVFDKKAEAVWNKRMKELEVLMKMNADEQDYIFALAEKLAFLTERGFTLKKYFGGIVDGWPYNYLRISKGGFWVEIKGSTIRRTDGEITHLSPYIYNTERLTLESLVKHIAEW